MEPDGKNQSGTPEESQAAYSAGAARRKAGIAFILVTLFIDILGIGIIIPVLPELVKGFVGADTSLAAFYYGILGASYSLMQFLCAPFVGALSDRYGRRPVILASMFGLGIDFLIQGFATSLTWLFIGRFLAGVFGASITTANAYIADVSDDDTRARNFGLVGVMFGLGFTCGPALGGLLGSIGPRVPFFAAAGLALVNWLYGYFILPESLAPEKRKAKFELSRANPFSSLDRLRAYPIILGLATAFVFMSFAQRGLENVWVLHGAYRYGWDELRNGLLLGLVGIMAIIVQGGLVRPTVKKLGERRSVILGLSISTLAFLGYGFAYEGWIVPIVVIFGSLGGVTGPAIQSIVTSSVDESEQGEVQGALTSLMSLTNIFAPLVFSAFLFSYFTCEQETFSPEGFPITLPAPPFTVPGAPFFFGAILLFIALCFVLRLFKRMPDQQDTAETSAS
ncbi:MAG: TCR/Tet family MFS transporter [Planctomycetota bacterium]